MKKLIVLALCAALVGCGDDAVDTVKEMTIPGYGEFTYGKVLDNHKVCESAEWKAFEDNGVKKVSYVCSLKKGKVSYNFDEKAAENIRQKAEKEYVENQKAYLKGLVETHSGYAKDSLATIDELNKVLKVNDYIAYYIDAKAAEEKDGSFNNVVDYIRRALDDGLLYSNGEPIRPYVDAMYKTEGYNRSVTGYGIGEIYKQGRSEGFTSEQVSAFNAVNKIIGEKVRSRINEEIGRSKESVEASNAEVEKYKAELADEAAIEEQSKKEGEGAVRRYAMTHIVKGEEVIVWAWNPVAEQYNIESQYRKQYEYAGTSMTSNLYMDQVIYSSVKNISDVDDYMQRSREIAGRELYRMIQSGKY